MLFALLWACQVEIAPATSAYDTPTATVGRTELGELQILDASGLEGVSDFGAALGFVNGQLVVGETFDGPCPHRLRKLDPGDAPTEGAVLTCPTAGDATFGTTVAGRDRQMVTGDQGLRYNSANGTLSAGAPGVFGPDGALHTSVLVLDGYRTMVGAPLDGPSGAVHTFVTNSVLEYDHALAPPPDLPEGAGFGARIQGTQELLVVETLDGTPSFYVPAEFGWKYWDRVEGPGAGRVLATFGAEILAEDPASDDLLFFTRENGAWVATGVLPGARGTAEHWAFDSVAVFGGRARTPVEPGAIDRWSRFAGALQASLPLTGEHTGLRMELDGDWLAVSELGTGTVSLFDWREERLDLYRELGGHFEELCLQVTSTLEAPIELADFVQEDGTVYAYGDITEDAGVWYRYVLPPHSGFDLTLSNPWHSGSGSGRRHGERRDDRPQRHARDRRGGPASVGQLR
ncbi:MAG: hypothetical protein KC656_15120 [Myxococcales bacterium]|nr:hypothetical protein [Myxococcales bacterium]